MATHQKETSAYQPLSSTISSSPHASLRNCRCNRYILPITTLLIWNALVGGGHKFLVYGPYDLIQGREVTGTVATLALLGAFSILGVVQMLYPIGGLMADICCGRFKIVVASTIAIWCAYILAGTAALVFEKAKAILVAHSLEILVDIMLILGYSGFKSNSVQFCLDQLQDATSEKIHLFLHWFVWTEHTGNMVVMYLIFVPPFNSELRQKLFIAAAATHIIIGAIALSVTFYKRKHFHCERLSSNPYWNVWKVIKFVAKHNKPLSYRSAFTYSDDIKPARMEFAKRIYGGPFKTEVVEDVRTFLRILLKALAIAAIFILEVPISYLFPLYGRHLGKNLTLNNIGEDYNWIFLESGIMSEVIPVLAIPVYLMLVYPRVRKGVPRSAIRLGVGISFKVASIISMFTIQTVANYTALKNPSRNITCFLHLDYFLRDEPYPTLEFPTEVLVIPNILNGIAEPLISITVLEFISAQSPHTMKGLLLGVFYAFRGLFLTLGSVAALPFALESLWGQQHGMLDCGFYYYLINSVFGAFGLVVFILAARWYRYRERDDPPYRHQYAEDYYSRHEDHMQYGSINS